MENNMPSGLFSQGKKIALRRTIQAIVAGGTLSIAAAASATVIDDTIKTTSKVGASAVSSATPSVFTGDIRKVAKAPEWQPGDPIKVVNPRRIRNSQDILPPVNPPKADPLVAKQAKVKVDSSVQRSANVNVNMDGLGFSGVNPPDPTGDVGLNYYIQSINGREGSLFSIHNKADGSIVADGLSMSDLHTGDCQSTRGDPIVLFDEQANRWLLTEFANPGINKLCVLISQTDDPVNGGWYAYEFQAPSFPDYPKYSQIGGVYYATANENTNAVYAFDREKMLIGERTSMIRVEVDRLAGFGFNSITPIDVDGNTPAPAGTPGMFIRHRDDELHNSGANNPEKDYLEIYTLAPNFEVPDDSVLTGPISIEIAEFNSDFNCAGPGFGCLTQKDSSYTLDPLRETVMYKGQYRNFDGHESIVGNFITNPGDNVAATRWFELRRVGEADWALHDEGSYTENDGTSRYMGGAALDKQGNLNVAYMMTGADRYPSIGFNGRRADDPAGTLTFGETILKEGTSSIESDRNGDYSQMGIDPVDNCTMWFTSEYGKESGTWGTQISSFDIPACTDPNPGFTLAISDSVQEVCQNGDLAPMAVSASPYNDFDDNIMLSYGEMPEGLSGSFSVNTFKPGEPVTANVTIAEGTEAMRYEFMVQATSGDAMPRSVSASVNIVAGPATVGLSMPENGAEMTSVVPEFSWESAGGAKVVTIEIATDAEFANIVATGEVSGGNSYRPSMPLKSLTQYYWRVSASNICGENTSEVYTFTTEDEASYATELFNQETSAPLTLGDQELTFFFIEVLEGGTDLTIATSGDNGDADLYVTYGARIQSGVSPICVSETFSSNEICEFEGEVQPGLYFAAVYAWAGFSNLTITASYDDTNVVITPIIGSQNFVSVDEDGSVELTMNDVNISNIRNTSSLVLSVSEGENYTVEDNMMMPVADFAGQLIVPVVVTRNETPSEAFHLYVNVIAINDAPMAVDDTVTLEEDSSASVSVLENDTDVDAGDTLTITEVVYEGTGTVEISDGSLTYTPAAGFVGDESLMYTIADSAGETSQASVAITVTAKPDPVVPDTSSGGGRSSSLSPLFGLLLLPLMRLRRRKVK